MSIYQLGLLGFLPPGVASTLNTTISQIISGFGLSIGADVSIDLGPNFSPNIKQASAAIYFGAKGVIHPDISPLIANAVPIVPVVSNLNVFSLEIPSPLRNINGLSLSEDDAQLTKIATVLLECVGLLPRQRRVFLSYRRTESREVALQLFEAFSARQFDVFLDTHGVPPALDFQAILWHRLCDSDVVVMLDTPSYFDSRWTAAEFGRAQAKSITILRLGWPGHTASPRLATQPSIQLTATDFDASNRLTDLAIANACSSLELYRSKSIAIRHSEIVGTLRVAMRKLGGTLDGIGQHRSTFLTLADGTKIVAYPVVGVPTAETIHDAETYGPKGSVAVVYDHVGLHEKWQRHLGWLAEYVREVRFVRTSDAAWIFGAWECR